MISKNIIALGVNSFFTDFSTEMILPLLPLFLERFLHANKSEIGLIEGVAEFGVALLIALSGFLSDRMGKRKNLVLWGYALSNLIKPLAFFCAKCTYGCPCALFRSCRQRDSKCSKRCTYQCFCHLPKPVVLSLVFIK